MSTIDQKAVLNTLDGDDGMKLLFNVFEDFTGVKMQDNVCAFVLLGMCAYPDIARHGLADLDITGQTRIIAKYGQQIQNIHDQYVGNQLSDEQFYEKYKDKLYDIFEFMGSCWGATLETFIESTNCSDSDIIACTAKFKHDLFGFLVSHAMDEIEYSWTNDIKENESIGFTVEDVLSKAQ